MNCSQKSTPYRLTRSLGQGSGDGVGHEGPRRLSTARPLMAALASSSPPTTRPTNDKLATLIAQQRRATSCHFRFCTLTCGNFWFRPLVRGSGRLS